MRGPLIQKHWLERRFLKETQRKSQKIRVKTSGGTPVRVRHYIDFVPVHKTVNISNGFIDLSGINDRFDVKQLHAESRCCLVKELGILS